MFENTLNVRKPNLEVVSIGLISSYSLKVVNALICPQELLGIIFFLCEIFIPKKFEFKIFKNSTYQSISKLLILWASSQLISDIFNKTTLISSLKGVLTPLLILLSLRFLIIISLRYKKYFIEDYILGIAIYELFNALILSSSTELAMKMRGTVSIAIIIFSLFVNKFFNKIINFSLIIISFAFGIRSSMTRFILLFFNSVIIKKNIFARFKTSIFYNVLNGIFKYLLIILLLVLSSPISNSINRIVVKFYQNDSRLEFLERQSQGGFFSARTEYFTFFDAFKDSPLIGHGSWPIDNNYKYSLIAKRGDLLYKEKTDRKIINYINKQKKARLSPSGKPYIPAHSYIQQTILWGGLFSSFFFFYLFNLNFFILLNAKFNYVINLVLINFAWDILFSPIGDNRFYIPIVCLIMINKLNEIYKNKLEETKN